MPNKTPFFALFRAFRARVASTVSQGRTLSPRVEVATELLHICTADQYHVLIPCLFPGALSTKAKPYTTLADKWAAFNALAHNRTHAVSGEMYPPLVTATIVPVHAAAAGGVYAHPPPHQSGRWNPAGRAGNRLTSGLRPMPLPGPSRRPSHCPTTHSNLIITIGPCMNMFIPRAWLSLLH